MSSISLADVADSVKRHITLFIFVMIATVIGAGVVSFLLPQKYTATAELYATYSDSSSSAGNMSDINTANSYIQSQIKSYPQLAQTEAVLQPVLSDLNLSYTVQALSDMVTITNPTDTMLIDISVQTRDPQMSQSIANAVAASLGEVVSSSLYSSESSPIKLSLVQKAILPTDASSPNLKLNLIAGVLLGLVLGLVLVILKDVLEKRVSSVSDLTDITASPLMGSIPRSNELETTVPVIVASPNTHTAEEFRRIRANLTFVAPVADTKARQIVVTSSEPSEGKTITIVNLAVALAENGARVLLIDADLRHPSVAAKLDLDGAVGLAHVLSGQANVVDAVQPYWRPNLHILSAGPKPPQRRHTVEF